MNCIDRGNKTANNLYHGNKIEINWRAKAIDEWRNFNKISIIASVWKEGSYFKVLFSSISMSTCIKLRDFILKVFYYKIEW